MTDSFDLKDDNVIVVIGSGAGGGTLSNELAQRGVKVVCLEAGARLDFADIENDPAKMDAKMGWHDPREGSPTWLCKTVGGTTMRWSGVSLRLKDYEMRTRSEYGPIAGTTIIDWPITLSELAPYYDLAEQKMGVSGTHDLPSSAETNNYKVMKAGGTLAGYSDMTSGRMAINSVDRDNRPKCQQIAFCWSGCAIGAKWSTLYTEIPKAEATGNFELRPKSMVTRINHDKQGKITGVLYADENGVEHEQKARAVCVAGNVIETTRLLLNSASPMFPDGLANASGHVGRNYLKHQHNNVAAEMPGPVFAHRGARQTGLIMDEWHHDPTREFAGGYILQATFVAPSFLPLTIGGWGEELAEYMDKFTNLAFTFSCGEDLPRADNTIGLHKTRTDANGLPVPVLKYTQDDNSKKMEAHSRAAMTKVYEVLGAKNIWHTEGNHSTCHNMGVARMSENPNDGATTKWGSAHEIPNLFISDGSLFPSGGAGNPTLTIVALAIRQAEYIANQMARGEL